MLTRSNLALTSSFALALALATTLPGAAYAAAAEPADTDSPSAAPKAESGAGDVEIIVTARRMEERLQDVPISITVYNQQQLASRNIVQASDLAVFTPSLSSNNNFGSLNTSFAIRGFVQDPGTQPSVGVYFADVVSPRGAANTVPAGDGAGPGSFFDLQNVQVLKGPQGTLFGRNTTGGAVLLVPQKPTNQFEGYVEGSYGNYDLKRIQGVVNIPLGEQARLRLGVDHQSRDGYLKNDSGIGPSRFGDNEYTAARASLVVDLTPDLENYTIASYSRASTTGDLEKIIASGSGYYGTRAAQQLATEAAKGAGFYTLQNSVNNPYAKLTQWQIINTTTWHASDNLTVKNIVSYAQFTERLQSQLFGTYWNPGAEGVLGFASTIPAPGMATADQSTVSEELQFQGKTGRLTWQAGGYVEISDPLGPTGSRSPTLLACTDYNTLDCTNPTGSGSVGYSTSSTTFRNYGIYAQGTYELTDQLNLTGGLRYTWDRAKSEVSLQTYDLVSPTVIEFEKCNNPGLAAPACINNYEAHSQKPTWLIDLDYKPDNNVLLYTKYARGYRAGGISLPAPPEVATFAPEKVDSFEIGAKTQIRGPLHATFNVAGFYNNFDNQQIKYNLYPKPGESGVSQASATTNAGKSRIYGVEMEAAITPFTGLKLEASYTYLNAKIVSFNLPTLSATSLYTTGDQTVEKGDPLALSPKNKVSVSATYTLPLDEDIGRVSFGATFVHVDKQLTNYVYRNADDKLDGMSYVSGHNLLSLNLNWASVAGKPIDLSFFATNVTNEKYYDFIPGLGADVLGFEAARLGEPRMFGGRLKYRFGG